MIGQNNMILDFNDIQSMSIDQKVDLYRQGYRLVGSLGSKLEGLHPASCPQSGQKTRGTTETISLKVKTTTIPPYTPIFTVDGIQQNIVSTWDSINNKFTFPWTFNETGSPDPGTPHTYATSVKDSCPTGPKTSNVDSCTINIITTPAPAQAGAGSAGIIIIAGLSLLTLFVVMKK